MMVVHFIMDSSTVCMLQTKACNSSPLLLMNISACELCITSLSPSENPGFPPSVQALVPGLENFAVDSSEAEHGLGVFSFTKGTLQKPLPVGFSRDSHLAVF